MRNNIILTGFMGSGKSTIGKMLAETLDKKFIDSDSFIESQKGCSIKEIFARQGEGVFRELERNFITLHAGLWGHVIATGGGMPIFFDVRKMGFVIFLDAGFEVIASRLHGNITRPLFKNKQKAKTLYDMRKKIYLERCDMVINAEEPRKEVVAKIIKNLPPDP